MHTERMLKYFSYYGKPADTRWLIAKFDDLAMCLADEVPAGPERTEALRKLLESHDAAIRALRYPGG